MSEFKYAGKSYILESIRELHDYTTNEIRNEVKQRKEILTWMHQYMIRDFEHVAQIVSSYGENPNNMLAKISSPPKQSLLERISSMQSEENVDDKNNSLHDVILLENINAISSVQRKKSFFVRLNKKNK